MASHIRGRVALHLNVLSSATRKALDFLSGEPWIARGGWYLAGGTGLALQVGHRQSIDLDFFTKRKEFDTTTLLHHLPRGDWKTTLRKENTLYGELFKAKISFIASPFFIPKQKMMRSGLIDILDPRDIAVMKMIAISQRGRKRDFFDLYWCANHVESLEKIIQKLKTQYPTTAHNYHHIFKSLVYFEDAESDPEPHIYFKADWGEVKEFFIKEVPRVAGKLLLT